ncbi:MAG TPA: ABC transporter ATP-binding protein [Acidimicrobiales bacterium]|jgi:ATP-binding cassette subfamily B protein|nr:ABC transporter ATP-binding protein [Acidimicrobiales bacterium]
MAMIMFASIMSSGFMVALPLIVKTVIDGPLHDGDRRGIVVWGLVAVALAMVDIAMGFSRRYLLAVVATELETHLRDDLYAHLQRLDVGFHDRWQSGQLLSRATTDLSIVRRFIGFGAVFFVLFGIQVVAIFGVLLTLHVWLALLTFVATIPVLVLCRRFERAYHDIVRDIQDQTGDLTTTIEEGARGIRVLKAFGRGREAYDGYNVQATRLYETHLDRIKLHTKFVWVLGLIPNLTLTAVLLGGVVAVGGGSLTVGGLVAFVSYVVMLTFPLEVLGWIMALAGEAESAAVRVYEVLDTEPTIQDRPGALNIDDVVGEIRFENVSFDYPASDRTALRNIDLVVPAGQTIAIVGATGSGKTSLVTLLTRLYDPTEGRILLDGHDLRDLTVNSLRRNVGFAFEEPSLFSASVRENLLMGKPDANDDEIARALDVAQAGFVLDLPWGLDTRIGEQGLSLSGGQRQRLALARAVIGRPRILVLDDPLSALDVHTEALVEDALRPLLRDCTVFVVVHRPSTIALADRAALLEDGRIVAVGSHHDLLETEPRYRAVLSEEAAHDDRLHDDGVGVA